jgi:solute:Na+ symporter, SSS family
VAVAVFGAIIALSLFVAFMASRGRDVLQIEEYLVGGRSFSGVLLFFLAVGEIYSIGTMVGLPGASTPKAQATGSSSSGTSCSPTPSGTSWGR